MAISRSKRSLAGVLALSSSLAQAQPVLDAPHSALALLTPGRRAEPRPAPAITLDSAIFVERSHLQGGALVRALEPAGRLVRGDRVVTLLTWARRVPGAGGGFTVTNALPHGLAWQGSADGDAELSVDGGRRWGRLGTLRTAQRLAVPEDVTTIRWRISPVQAAARSGRIAYSGLVR